MSTRAFVGSGSGVAWRGPSAISQTSIPETRSGRSRNERNQTRKYGGAADDDEECRALATEVTLLRLAHVGDSNGVARSLVSLETEQRVAVDPRTMEYDRRVGHLPGGAARVTDGIRARSSLDAHVPVVPVAGARGERYGPPLVAPGEQQQEGEPARGESGRGHGHSR